jgi:hypothetical protein
MHNKKIKQNWFYILDQAEYGQSIRPLFSNGEDSSPTYRMHTDRNGQQRQNLPYHQNLLSKPPNVLNSMTTMHMQEVVIQITF